MRFSHVSSPFPAWRETRHITDATLTRSPQASPEGSASSVSIGGLRPRRPSRAWTARSRLAPPNPSRSSLPTTRARRRARPCCPSCISRPIEGTQDPSHSRHSASGKRGTPQKKGNKLILLVMLFFFTLKNWHWKGLTAVLWKHSVSELINTLDRIIHLHLHILSFAVFLLLPTTADSDTMRWAILARLAWRWIH